MNIEDLIKAGVLVLNSRFCFNCKEEKPDKKCCLLKIKDQDKDLFEPFIAISLPFCIDPCWNFYKGINNGVLNGDDLDYERLLQNTLYFCEQDQVIILNG